MECDQSQLIPVAPERLTLPLQSLLRSSALRFPGAPYGGSSLGCSIWAVANCPEPIEGKWGSRTASLRKSVAQMDLAGYLRQCSKGRQPLTKRTAKVAGRRRHSSIFIILNSAGAASYPTTSHLAMNHTVAPQGKGSGCGCCCCKHHSYILRPPEGTVGSPGKPT